MAKLAFYTFGILREDRQHPQIQGFVDRTETVKTAADRSMGIIQRSTVDARWGEQVYPHSFGGDPPDGAPNTLSLWADLESVFAFAYAGVHAEALQHRKEWFLPPGWPTYVAWWVADDHTPDYQEAVARHQHLQEYGPTPRAFNFQLPFGPDDQPTMIDRTRVQELVTINARVASTE